LTAGLTGTKEGMAFRLYVAASGKVLGAVLTKDVTGREGVIAHLSKRGLDTEAQYTHIGRLCLVLYYACSKLWQYFLPLHGGKPI
jgi:hypothetical protein